MLAVHVVMRHQMERGFATRMLQHGHALVDRGEQNARGPIGFCGINTNLSHTSKVRVC
jgi:hypothetical protein